MSQRVSNSTEDPMRGTASSLEVTQRSSSPPRSNSVRGTVHPDFAALAEVFRRQIERARQGGAALCVYHRGEPVLDLWGGALDEQGRPWQKDTLGLCYSTTKGVAATLVHVLADRGLLDY